MIDKDVLKPLGLEGGNYVWPTLVESNHDMPIVKEELFVPITHILKVGVHALMYGRQVHTRRCGGGAM